MLILIQSMNLPKMVHNLIKVIWLASALTSKFLSSLGIENLSTVQNVEVFGAICTCLHRQVFGTMHFSHDSDNRHVSLYYIW